MNSIVNLLILLPAQIPPISPGLPRCSFAADRRYNFMITGWGSSPIWALGHREFIG